MSNLGIKLIFSVVAALAIYTIYYTLASLKKGEIMFLSVFEKRAYSYKKHPVIAYLIFIVQLGIGVGTLISYFVLMLFG